MPTLDVSELNISLATFSLFICGFGLVSYLVKHRLYISEALVATIFGIVIGPHVTGWVDPRNWNEHHYSPSGSSNELTLAVTRIAIAIQVLFAGIALPRRYLKIELRSLSIIIVGSMTAGWFTCALFIWWLVPGLTYMEALAIGGCWFGHFFFSWVPTDPVLVNSITKGRFAEEDVDPAVRNLIVAESGANDGLAYPFIYLPLFWFLAHSEEEFHVSRGLGGVIGRWIYETWIYEIVLSVVLGALIGYVARKSLRFAEKRQWLDEDNFLAYGVGLAFFCLGFLGMLGTDDLLAAFVAGNAFSWDDRQRVLHEDENVHDIIDTLVNAAVFVYIGAIIPFQLFGSGDPHIGAGHLVALAICILAFRRLPWVVLLHWWIPALRNWRHGVFAGWFGPMGVSAIFYVTLLLEELPKNRSRVHEVAEPIVFFIVMSSIIVHGISIPANKGITRLWDGTEKRYFPKQWEKYQMEKDNRDRELRAAEEGDPDISGGEQQPGERSGEATPRNDTMHDQDEGVKPRENLNRRKSARDGDDS